MADSRGSSRRRRSITSSPTGCRGGTRGRSATALRLTAALCLTACARSADDTSRTDTIALASSLEGADTAGARAGTPCSAGVTYTVADTSDWATMIEEGKRAVLRAGATIIDTVDVSFGVHAIGRDSLVFLPVVAYELDSAQAATLNAPAASPDEHTLCTPTGRTGLSSSLPHFNAGFSSPTVIDSTLYYWGLRLLDARGRYRLYAMRLVPHAGQVDSLFLREETPATDFRYFYGPPFAQDGVIVFEGGDARALIDSQSWRVVRVESRRQRPETADGRSGM